MEVVAMHSLLVQNFHTTKHCKMSTLTRANAKIGMRVHHQNVEDSDATIIKIVGDNFQIQWDSPAGIYWTVDFCLDRNGRLFTILDQPSETLVEKPCVSCQRMNNADVGSCWWCGNKPWN